MYAPAKTSIFVVLNLMNFIPSIYYTISPPQSIVKHWQAHCRIAIGMHRFPQALWRPRGREELLFRAAAMVRSLFVHLIVNF